ncbi:MAG: hypothetical protein D6717_08150 [Gammaproteobacteria bacterium]|nr:MAG: hypothetical protein D6717_08150 [Gammaproteobacteria bacterium]
MAEINRDRLQYPVLEKAIYGMQPLPELVQDSRFLDGWRIADYVGRPELGDADPRWKVPVPVTSEELFEDQGGFLFRFTGRPGEDGFDVAVFATFIVIELRPRTQRTEFLVLAPIPPAADEEELPYAAFLEGQNTKGLQERLRETDAQADFADEMLRLIQRLRTPMQDARGGFFSRLFGRGR